MRPESSRLRGPAPSAVCKAVIEPKTRGVYLHVGRLVIAVVEDVGSFNAELEFALPVEGEVLHQREEKLAVPGPTTPPTGALPKRPMPTASGGLKS